MWTTLKPILIATIIIVAATIVVRLIYKLIVDPYFSQLPPRPEDNVMIGYKAKMIDERTGQLRLVVLPPKRRSIMVISTPPVIESRQESNVS